VSDIAIRAVDLRKVYRLYKKPSYRFRDMFGLLGDRPDAFTEHAALDGVTLDIRRGEKVAIIGRNGAGKSTFLKLVTGVIQPTAGQLEVSARVHALLQIGTGFHPDFTGRENTYAYLAQVGVTGKDADRRCAEVIEFAELEEYIDQPVKTYSTGMSVRLMFAASTAITPDLLVLDEVLGVGDAYFSHKSFNRMRDLCERDGATLLLVTHDIYSAVKLCERLVWIDRGRVIMDGDGPSVIRAYEDSIRQQEEQRLRLRAQARATGIGVGPRGRAPILVEVRSRVNGPQPCPIYFNRIELVAGGTTLGALPLAAPSVDGAALVTDGTCWGDVVSVHGRTVRPFLNYGSPFHKIAGTVPVPAGWAPDAVSQLAIRAEYWSDVPCDLVADGFFGGRQIHFGALPLSEAAWTSFEGPALIAAGDLPIGGSAGRQGVGTIDVTGAQPIDADGCERYIFQHGEPFELRMRFRINDPDLRERPDFLIAFHRDGVQDVTRVLTHELLFDGSRAREGIVRMRFPRLMLANGTYTVTVMCAQEGYYAKHPTEYFSISTGVYTCLTRAFEITVENGGVVASGTGVVSEGEWEIVDAV
jgi:ABC-type polysaccharide/polyol phosphate transport system ATPase subunit